MLSELHDTVLYFDRVRDIAENKTWILAGGLDEDVSIIEDTWKDAVHLAGHVLDGMEAKLADATREETFLFDVHDTFFRDDPDVERDVDPDEK